MTKTISYNKFIRNTIVISMSIIIILFVLYGNYIQSSSIKTSIKNDAGVIADLVFQNLYTIMKNGGTKEAMDEVIADLSQKMPEVSISIIQSINSGSKDIVREVFSSQKAEIEQNKKNIYFASAIAYKKECLTCHTEVNTGETAAVILIEYPLLNLQISLKEILVMMSILFLLVVLVFFSIWYHFLSRYFVQPIKSLIKQIQSISSHMDLKKQIYIETSIKEVKQLEEAFNQQNQELISSYNNLEHISNTDSLTGVYNRKKFDEYASIIIKDAKRYNYDLSLVLIDLNRFKYINDNYGHQVGDEILILFSKIVTKLIRESDFFFRTGGDEFILLLPHTSNQEAKIVVNKIKEECLKEAYTHENIILRISASFGLSEYGTDSGLIGELIKIADERMYVEKKASRS